MMVENSIEGSKDKQAAQVSFLGKFASSLSERAISPDLTGQPPSLAGGRFGAEKPPNRGWAPTHKGGLSDFPRKLSAEKEVKI
jgi:hypothetical protein